MNLLFTPQAWEDYLFGQSTDRNTLKRINKLLDAVLRDPHAGIGKPEPLKYGIDGAWSRRITGEHRLVYVVTETAVVVLQARYHYSK
ncbi:Txe/YoeB family addiction module toxin [Mycobacterium sp.]|uniref:Txe/YoeB family addiction module toxin n=1 Tax=Mycobacterium sp. TaxID=1785 RepID=UPI0031E30C5A